MSVLSALGNCDGKPNGKLNQVSTSKNPLEKWKNRFLMDIDDITAGITQTTPKYLNENNVNQWN